MQNKDLENYLKLLKSKKVTSSLYDVDDVPILKIEFNHNTRLFVYCSWRIECDHKVFATCRDDKQAQYSLNKLKDAVLIDIELSEQYDLVLQFNDNLCLRVFCNISFSCIDENDDYNANWELGFKVQNLYFRIDNNYILISEKYYS